MSDATASVSASLPIRTIAALDREAARAGLNRSQIIRRLLEKALAQESK